LIELAIGFGDFELGGIVAVYGGTAWVEGHIEGECSAHKVVGGWHYHCEVVVGAATTC
jgi:hypothetical protein